MPVIVAPNGNTLQAQQAVEQAAQVLAAGGTVVFPTETVYGIGADVANDVGYEALRQFKRADEQVGFAVHLPDPDRIGDFIDLSHRGLRRLVSKVCPGPVTFLVDVGEDVIETKMAALGLDRRLKPRLYHQGRIALRCPDHDLGRAILGAVEGPIVASSANAPGQRPPLDAEQAAQAVGDAAGLVVDGGRCRYAKPSTVVQVTGSGAQTRITVAREGVLDERMIRKLMRWTVLLVCSGNTCRSPMAEALARQVLAQQMGVTPETLEAAGVRVLSAGTYAMPGMPASPEAVQVLARMGLDLAKHRSRELTVEMMNEADVIYCMTQAHRDAIVRAYPPAAHKTFLLDPQGDVSDPIGSGQEVYQQCADQIRERLEARLKEQEP